MADAIQVGEYPGKTEHYRMCLDIIANAQGEERPGIKSFIETGSRRASRNMPRRYADDVP